jgi:hypothetical protein
MYGLFFWKREQRAGRLPMMNRDDKHEPKNTRSRALSASKIKMPVAHQKVKKQTFVCFSLCALKWKEAGMFLPLPYNNKPLT